MASYQSPGEYLRSLRQAAGKSGRQVATESEKAVSHTTIQGLEANLPGTWEGVSLRILEALARGLGVNPDEFVANVMVLRRGGQRGDPVADYLRLKNVIRRTGRAVQRFVPITPAGLDLMDLAGGGDDVPLADLFEHFAFDPEPEKDKVIVIAHDSKMEPLILDGDELLVSLDGAPPPPGRLTLFHVPGEGLLLRVFLERTTKGVLRCRQANPAQDQTLPEESQVLGSVVAQQRPPSSLESLDAKRAVS